MQQAPLDRSSLYLTVSCLLLSQELGQREEFKAMAQAHAAEHKPQRPPPGHLGSGRFTQSAAHSLVWLTSGFCNGTHDQGYSIAPQGDAATLAGAHISVHRATDIQGKGAPPPSPGLYVTARYTHGHSTKLSLPGLRPPSPSPTFSLLLVSQQDEHQRPGPGAWSWQPTRVLASGLGGCQCV